MKNIGNKVLCVLLCFCLMACFVPGAFAMQTQKSIVEEITLDGTTYTTETSFLSNGDVVVSVIGGGTIANAIVYAENNTLVATEWNPDTGEIISSSINLNEITEVESSDSLNFEGISGSSRASVSASSSLFGIGYTNYLQGTWTINKEFTTSKTVQESGNNGLNSNNLNGFRSCVDTCMNNEGQFLLIVGTTTFGYIAGTIGVFLTLGTSTLLVAAGLAALSASGGAFGYTAAAAQFTSCVTARDNAIVYYDAIV